MNQLFTVIDVNSKNNVVYLMKPDGGKYSSFSVQNNLGGAKLLSERIASALSAMQLDAVVIGMEATSIYGNNLVYALREDGSLGRFQRKIRVLNPKQVKKFKEAYSELPKNDWVDAFVIADHLRFGRIAKEVYMDDYRYKALQTLTRARFDVIQNLTREKQRFANYLFLKCSGMAQDKNIANSSATTIALMERFETVDELANADLDELTALPRPYGSAQAVQFLRFPGGERQRALGIEDAAAQLVRVAVELLPLRCVNAAPMPQDQRGVGVGVAFRFHPTQQN